MVMDQYLDPRKEMISHVEKKTEIYGLGKDGKTLDYIKANERGKEQILGKLIGNLTMSKVIIYTRDWCGFCDAAKSLLSEKGVKFEEIDLGENPEKLKEMIEKSNRRTVPQIFIDVK